MLSLLLVLCTIWTLSAGLMDVSALAVKQETIPVSPMTQTRSENFNKNYTLTGNGAKDILIIANAQLGRTGSELGYSQDWCANFVCDCAKLAGQSDAVPFYGEVSGLASRILNAGGWEVSVAEAQPGDICCIDWKNGGGIWDHVEIVYAANGSSVSTIGGNSGVKNGNVYTRKVVQHNPLPNQNIIKIIRPNYKNTAPTYANVGDDFYGVILNTQYWKPITKTDDENRITLDTEAGVARQKWHFVRQSDNAYVITSCQDGKALEMTDGIRENYTQLTAHDYWGGYYQQWYLIPQGNGYIFLSKHYADEQWVMDLRDDNSADGAVVNVYQRNNTSAQIWTIYTGDEVQLQSTVLTADIHAPTVSFSWERRYGIREYRLRIWKDELWKGDDYYYEVTNNTSSTVELPAGTYYAYVDTLDYYQCCMSNLITLEIPEIPGPQITSQPNNAAVFAGQKVTFSAAAEGTGLSYQWQYSKDGTNWTNSTASKTASISFTAKAAFNGRQYRCVITDANGKQATTVAAMLTVKNGAQITMQPKSVTAVTGKKVTFSVAAEGLGLTYQWQYSKDGKNWTNSTASKTASISFTAKESFNGRQYRCIVTDQYGKRAISDSARLTVTNSLVITHQPQAITVAAGDKALFAVRATGTGLTYQWQYSVDNGKTWKNSTASKTSAVSFTAKASFDGRLYRCVVTDAAGQSVISDTARLTIAK